MKHDRRTRDLAFLLPLGLLLFLMPPYIGIFDHHALVAGIPLLPTYIFIVWAASILLAFGLSRRVLRAEKDEDDDEV